MNNSIKLDTNSVIDDLLNDIDGNEITIKDGNRTITISVDTSNNKDIDEMVSYAFFAIVLTVILLLIVGFMFRDKNRNE